MLSHQELLFLLVSEFPDITHGRDFWVGHPVAPNSSEQIGSAAIMAWEVDGVPVPDVVLIRSLELKYADELAAFRAKEARAERLPNLSPRQLWLMALDIGIAKDSLLAQLDAWPDQQEAAALRIELTEPPQYGYERDSPAVEFFREMEGLESEHFDDLWAWASGK